MERRKEQTVANRRVNVVDTWIRQQKLEVCQSVGSFVLRSTDEAESVYGRTNIEFGHLNLSIGFLE